MTQTVVHTGAGPNIACPEEERILPEAGVEFIKRGPCPTPEQVIEAISDADVAICFN